MSTCRDALPPHLDCQWGPLCDWVDPRARRVVRIEETEPPWPFAPAVPLEKPETD